MAQDYDAVNPKKLHRGTGSDDPPSVTTSHRGNLAGTHPMGGAQLPGGREGTRPHDALVSTRRAGPLFSAPAFEKAR